MCMLKMMSIFVSLDTGAIKLRSKKVIFHKPLLAIAERYNQQTHLGVNVTRTGASKYKFHYLLIKGRA